MTKSRRRLKIYLALAAIIAALSSRLFLFSVYTVKSNSMAPSLKVCDQVYAWKVRNHQAAVGEVIVFSPHFNASDYVKRVSAIRSSIGEQFIYVLGDNPDDSYDSRDFGWLNSNLIKGKVFASFTPYWCSNTEQ